MMKPIKSRNIFAVRCDQNPERIYYREFPLSLMLGGAFHDEVNFCTMLFRVDFVYMEYTGIRVMLLSMLDNGENGPYQPILTNDRREDGWKSVLTGEGIIGDAVMRAFRTSVYNSKSAANKCVLGLEIKGRKFFKEVVSPVELFKGMKITVDLPGLTIHCKVEDIDLSISDKPNLVSVDLVVAQYTPAPDEDMFKALESQGWVERD